MQISKSITTSIQIGSIFSLLCLTLMNVETRWSNADVLLAKILPTVGLAGLTCLLLNKKAWQWMWTDIIIGIWMLYWLLRVWVGAEFPCGTDFLQTVWMCLLYMFLRLTFTGCDRQMPYAVTLLILVFGSIESFWGAWQLLNGASRHSVFLLTANFLNPGPYSAYPMLGAISGIMLLSDKWNIRCNETANKKYQSSVEAVIKVLTLTCLMILPSTWSRAAWLSIGLIILWAMRKKYWKWRYWIWGILLLFTFLAFIVKRGSAEGRLIIWAAALTSWWETPIIGVGYGGFCHAVADGISSLYNQNANLFSNFHNAGVTEYSYNALLQILVEQGLCGALLCLMIVVMVIRRLYQVCVPLMYCLLGLLIFSCFSYPFDTLPYRIILVMIVALSASLHNLNPEGPQRLWAPLLLGCASIGLSLPMGDRTKERLKIDEEVRIISDVHDDFFLKDLYVTLPQNRDNADVLFNIAKMLQDKGRWRDSNAILHMGTEVSADPMFYVLQGNNFQHMEHPVLAEQAYIKAFSIMPNRLYPLYNLLCLYQETQQNDKALDIAKQIATMNPKVQSPATDEMQQKAKEYIESVKSTTNSDSFRK